MDKSEILSNKLQNSNNAKNQANKLFEAIWNVEKFFSYYKQFNKNLVEKTSNVLSYSWHISLGVDELQSESLYSKFFDAFIKSIKWIIGDDVFYDLSIQPTKWNTDNWWYRSSKWFCDKPYLLSKPYMINDSYKFIDHRLECVTFWDNTIAQFYHRRTGFNNVEINYIIYPNLIFKLINKSLKEKWINEIEFSDNSINKNQSIWKYTTFFDYYKDFEEYLEEKTDNIISFLWCVEKWESEKSYSKFFDIFIQSLRETLSDNEFNNLKYAIDNDSEDYILSNHMKMNDENPFLNDKFKSIIYKNNIIAQFYHREKEPNHVEFSYTIYPKRIFEESPKNRL